MPTVPASHGAGDELPSAHQDDSGQVVQAVLPSDCWKVPAAHWSQPLDAPLSAWYWPPAHLVHVGDPLRSV